MSKARGGLVSRRLLVGSLVFGVFVLFDIALFGWLIFRSLSQREIEEALLETRMEAESLAERIAGSATLRDQDLYTALASETITQTYIDSILHDRAIVHAVQVYDSQGRLVYQVRTEANVPQDGTLEDPSLLTTPEVSSQGQVVQEVENRSFDVEVPDIEVPIGEIGTLEIGISPKALGERIEVLRTDLIREASAIGGVTLTLLLSAYLIIWLLYLRSRRLERQAAEAERMAYIGTLASGLAHEIRNPLNSLNLNMQMLGEELTETGAVDRGGRLLSITQAEISRLERLVTDFLSYARPRPLEVEVVPVRELLDRARQVLTGTIRRLGARVVVEDSTGGGRLRGDPAQLGQLLLNLAQNALAATEGSARTARLRLCGERQGTTAVLRVEDNGVGIPPEDVERVFDLFYSTRKGGSGLGLAIVQRIAQNHGGRVEVESAAGGGTSFSVYLPGAMVEEPATREAGRLPVSPRPGRPALPGS